MRTKLIYIALFFSSFSAIAQTIPKSALKTVLDFIAEHNPSANTSDINIKTIYLQKDTLFSIFYNSNLYIVYNHIDESNRIWAFSFSKGLLEKDTEKMASFLSSVNVLPHPKNSAILKNTYEEEVHGPLLKSKFGQSNCHDENGNIINVTNIYTPQNAPVGCVALSMTQVLHYFQWPNSPKGQKNYTDNSGNNKGVYDVSFDNYTINWSDILNEYNYKVSTATQKQALGQIAYLSAIALEMDFESSGSTSNVNKIPQALSGYFNTYGEYRANNNSDFFLNIDTMILKNTVVPLAISGNGYGHSIICDGWQILSNRKKYYHLNMGWWGETDGWYQIQSAFNAGGYSVIDGGMFNAIPTPDIKADMQNNNFLIQWEIAEGIEHNGFELQAKIGRNSWTTISENTYEKKYTLNYDGSSDYAFRVRMRYTNFPDIIAWSNMFIVDKNYTYISTNAFENSIKIYPNPTKNILYIKNLNAEKINEIIISNIMGKTIYRTIISASNQDISIDLNSFEKGMYFIQIKKDNISLTNKLIKE